MSHASAWIPLVVAGLGISGTLAASVCSQMLEGKREQRRQKESRNTQTAERWLSDRQHLYAEFITTMEPWVRWVTTLRFSTGKAPRETIDPGLPRSETYVETAQSLLARMELIAGQGVVEATRGFWGWAGMASIALTETSRSDASRDEIYGGVQSSYNECIDAMREDLGVAKFQNPGWPLIDGHPDNPIPSPSS